MYFEINGKTYTVKFYRNNTTTYAELLEVGDSGLTHLGLTSVAFLYYKDRFEKSKGRKASLAHLLGFLSNPTNAEVLPFPPLNKEQRELVWNKYFEKHSK